ncbi:MAG: hypothetical protein VW495_07230, partial [Rhodobiaceae bacterium]
MPDAAPSAAVADNGAGEQFGDIACRRVGPRIDDGGNPHPGGGKVGCRAVSVIIVREDGDAFGRRGGPAVDIAAYGAGLHDPRPVIIVEGDQPFGRPGGQNR